MFKFNFAIQRASPWVKLMTLDLRSPAPLLIWLWPMKYGHWETTSRKKCLLHPKNITFYNFRRTDFQKAPLCAFKSTPFTCLSAFFAHWASAREWSRMRRLGKIVPLSFPIPSLVAGLPTIDFIRFFNSAAKCCPCIRKTHDSAKIT